MPYLALRLAALLIGLVPMLADAGVYRWVDENGVTVYSQWPAPAANAVRIERQSGPSEVEQAAAEERLQRQREQIQDATDQQRKAAEERAQAAAQDEQRAANCATARKNLATLGSLGPRMIRTPDGRYLRMTEEEVAQQIRTAQKQIDEYCQ